MTDCNGTGQVWGCGCERCLPRRHPLDLIARLTQDELDAYAAMRPEAPLNRGFCYCGQRGRFYAGGWRCDAHTQQAPGLLMQSTRDAIGSYVREHGTSPWPRKDSKPPKVLREEV